MDHEIGAKLKNFQDKFDQLFKEINSINENVNVFKRLIAEIADKYQDVEALKPLNHKFESSVKAYQNLHDSLKSQKDVLKVEIDSISHKLNKMNVGMEESQKRLENIEYNFNALKNSQEAKFSFIQQHFNTSLDALRKELQSSLSKMQADLIVSPASVYEQNNNLVRKLESASLDGTNAMLKVNNMDLAIRIIEKKIENLSILIKKIELQAQ